MWTDPVCPLSLNVVRALVFLMQSFNRAAADCVISQLWFAAGSSTPLE